MSAGSVFVAPPSSALRAPSPVKGEGNGAGDAVSNGKRARKGDGPADTRKKRKPARQDVWGPSPLMGEGGRRPDEGGAKVARARSLRQRMTEAEKRMWFLLRDRRFDGLKFRRQVPVGRFVADFACYDAKVIIELDGSQHAGSPGDIVRDADLRGRGFEVVRVWNNELFLDPDAVMRAVQMAVERQGRTQ